MKHTIKSRSQRRASHFLKPQRLQLESLEARLPLGDALLGTLLGSSLLASSLSWRDSSYRASEETLTDALQVNHGHAHLDSRFVLETHIPICLQGQPNQACGGDAWTSGAHVVANKESDALRWSSQRALFEVR